MKKIILTLLLLSIFFNSRAQTGVETEIRKLEDEQREAFLKKDTATLFKLFSPDFVVNAPTNKITTLKELKLLMHN